MHHHLHPPISILLHLSLLLLLLLPTTTTSLSTTTPLPSIFPPDTPTGIQGEAIRSSLRTRGLCYDLSSFQSSLLSLRGKGTISFLNQKFTNQFSSNDFNRVKQTCWLTSRGRIRDLIQVVVVSEEEAWILTSPRSNTELYDTLQRLIFPLDQVELTNCDYKDWTVFCVGSSSVGLTQRILRTAIDEDIQFPERNSCVTFRDGIVWDGGMFLPPCALRGYTFLVPNDDTTFQTLTSSSSSQESAPLPIALSEWDSLRIESGYPSLHHEMTGDDNPKSNPLELSLLKYVDLNKGCFLGQEGVSAMAKNKRGIPRQLYSVVFEEDENDFDSSKEEDEEERGGLLLPRVGDELFVLGSNYKIKVGVLTSVGERGGTGQCNVVGLGLVRRREGILKKMKEMELELPKIVDREEDDDEGRRMMPFVGVVASSEDPLHGLEVILKNGFTKGILKVLPRTSVRGNMFDESVVGEEEEEEQEDIGSVMGYVVPMEESEEDVAKAMEEAEQAAQEAEKAAAEAKRKAEKMELLKKRAEAAMAARKKKQTEG